MAGTDTSSYVASLGSGVACQPEEVSAGLSGMKGKKEEKMLTLDASNSLGSEKHTPGSLQFPCALLWAGVL